MTVDFLIHMKLHQNINDGSVQILRVPGGWVYNNNTFVPEVAQKKKHKTFEEDNGALEMRKEVRSLFFERYKEKAKEIKGSDKTADGREIAPVWSGKEATLLKSDIEQYGPRTMADYIELFFSDKVKEVKEFCRVKEKAGYSYSVFHGMLGKLALATETIPSKCSECGQRGGHAPTCPIILKREAIKKAEIDEIMSTRGDEAVDLVGAFKTKVKESYNGAN